MWQQKRDSALQAGRVASKKIESARPVAERMTKAIGRGDWAQVLERKRPSTSLPRLIGAAVAGGAFMYFMDPFKGAERRMSALGAGRRAAQQLADAVRPLPGLVGSRVTNAFGGGVKSRAS
jgi:hypothetical protein